MGEEEKKCGVNTRAVINLGEWKSASWQSRWHVPTWRHPYDPSTHLEDPHSFTGDAETVCTGCLLSGTLMDWLLIVICLENALMGGLCVNSYYCQWCHSLVIFVCTYCLLEKKTLSWFFRLVYIYELCFSIDLSSLMYLLSWWGPSWCHEETRYYVPPGRW